jgi:hypothetical protein
MADPTQFVFSHRDLAEILVHKQNLHEGLWQVAFQLGMGQGNTPAPTGVGTVPSIVVSILAVNLQKADKENPSTVDAAKVNPHKK